MINVIDVSPTVRAKAAGYLAEHRLDVEHADRRAALFTGWVRGSAPAAYLVQHTPGAGWSCACPSSRACAHAVAASMVFHPPTDEERERARQAADPGYAARAAMEADSLFSRFDSEWEG